MIYFLIHLIHNDDPNVLIVLFENTSIKFNVL